MCGLHMRASGWPSLVRSPPAAAPQVAPPAAARRRLRWPHSAAAARPAADATGTAQRRGAAAAAGKRPPRPQQQTYAAPKPGAGGAAQEVQLTAEEVAARERANYVMAGAMLSLVGYGYYVTVIKKPSYSGKRRPGAPAMPVWESSSHDEVAAAAQLLPCPARARRRA